MKLFLLSISTAIVLAACGTLSAGPAATTVQETLPGPTRTPVPATTTAPIITSSPMPTVNPPAIPEGWKTFNHGDYIFRYPPTYYIPTSTDPVLLIADAKTTYDSWMQTNSVNNSGLLIQLMSLSLDRRLDPNKDPSQLATVEQALHREINFTVGTSNYVSGSIDVPWENANGGTSDGRKVFYTSVPYQNTILGTTRAAKVIGNNSDYFFIPVPNDDSRYVRIIVQPASSILNQAADQILSTFTFTH